MKTKFWGVIAITMVAMLSCSEREQDELTTIPDADGPKSSVRLAAAALADSNAAVPLKDLISQLTFIAYRSNGTEQQRRTQLNSDPAFGQVDMDLPYDVYKIVMIGSKSRFGINQYFQGTSTNDIRWPFNDACFQYLQQSDLMGNTKYQTSDTFFAYRTLNLNTPDLTYSLSLKRIVGMLEIEPTDVSRYDVEIKNDSYSFDFSDQSSFGGTRELHWVGNLSGKSCFYILKTHEPVTVDIIGGGRTKRIYAPVFKNQRTIIKGSLLAPSSDLGMSVSIDTKWAVDTTLVPL